MIYDFDSLSNGYDDPLWCCNVQIIAWRPLPESYKGEEEAEGKETHESILIPNDLRKDFREMIRRRKFE